MPAAIGLASVGIGDIWEDEYLISDRKLEVTHLFVTTVHVHPSVLFEVTIAAVLYTCTIYIIYLFFI